MSDRSLRVFVVIMVLAIAASGCAPPPGRASGHANRRAGGRACASGHGCAQRGALRHARFPGPGCAGRRSAGHSGAGRNRRESRRAGAHADQAAGA